MKIAALLLAAGVSAGQFKAPGKGALAASPLIKPVAIQAIPTLPPAASATVAPSPIVGAAESGAAAKVSPTAQLRGVAAAGQEQADGKPSDAAGQRFDNAKPADGGSDGIDEDGAASGDLSGQPAGEMHKLWFSGREAVKAVMKSEIYAQIRPIKNTRGSHWHWESFQPGSPALIKSGRRTLFTARVQAASSKRLGDLKREDFEGVFNAKTVASLTLPQLRKRLVKELEEANDRARKYRPMGPFILTNESLVRVVRLTPFKEARVLAENGAEAALAPAARKDIAIPPALHMAQHYLPKAVFLDLRQFPNGIPYQLHEDMTKLMKAGVYFIMLSDKKIAGPDSVDELLSKGLTSQQMSAVGRYKMVVVGENGNAVASFKGDFPNYLPVRRFEPNELEIMDFALRSLGANVLEHHSTELRFALGKGVKAGQFLDKLQKQLKSLALDADYEPTISESGGRATIVLHPQSLESSIPSVLEALRDHEGLFLNNSDIMAIAKDEKILKALDGAIKPGELAPNLEGADLLDMSMAGLLGDYRINGPRDFAASASKIGAFKKGYTESGGMSASIYMMEGHVIHSAFNWALWKYRNSGKMPEDDDVVLRAKQNWDTEVRENNRNLFSKIGPTLGDSAISVERRVRSMYAMLKDLVALYPIMVGTELPNLYSFDRYKKGELSGRDIMRLIFDGVLARVTEKGLEIMIIDFKTGQSATNDSFKKLVQVQLYDLIVRSMWKRLSIPYGATGEFQKVADSGITFIYPNDMHDGGQLNEDSRIKFEKYLKNIMNRMRKVYLPAEAKPVSKAASKYPEPKAVKIDRSRSLKGGFDTLKIPRVVPGIKIKKEFTDQIVAGTKMIEYRKTPSKAKPFVAIIQTFTDEEPGRPAEVVAFARIAEVTKNGGEFEYHLSHVTPVKPYAVPGSVNKSGTVIWVKDVPVQGPRRLKK